MPTLAIGHVVCVNQMQVIGQDGLSDPNESINWNAGFTLKLYAYIKAGNKYFPSE